jgi:hypothetical protein
MLTDSRKDCILTATAVAVLVIGTATGNAYLMLGLSAAALALCAAWRWRPLRSLAPLLAVLAAASTAFAVGLVLSNAP